jgi:hypothetical protein
VFLAHLASQPEREAARADQRGHRPALERERAALREDVNVLQARLDDIERRLGSHFCFLLSAVSTSTATRSWSSPRAFRGDRGRIEARLGARYGLDQRRIHPVLPRDLLDVGRTAVHASAGSRSQPARVAGGDRDLQDPALQAPAGRRIRGILPRRWPGQGA